ncbi:hypothetical protein C4K04_4730 [Pseudomonas chlororaphis]|uniref:Uncharacterized protein n=1 Tax=Pseudomonas chlororaphis TaxID=587753 RepID=A0A3G7TTE3_9PSED|nr:hypothetical protein C4K04_4730 [Pseudomonas chlororaphis]
MLNHCFDLNVESSQALPALLRTSPETNSRFRITSSVVFQKYR